jgi:hypothetical protein
MLGDLLEKGRGKTTTPKEKTTKKKTNNKMKEM